MSVDCHKITIQETNRQLKPDPHGREAWSVQITIDGDNVPKFKNIRDPFASNEHYDCQDYLNHSLTADEKPDDTKHVSYLIDRYRKDLSEALKIKTRIKRSFSHARVEINICDYTTTHAKDLQYGQEAKPSIHSIYWELLENIAPEREKKVGFWPTCVNSVTVRRVVRPKIRGSKEFLPSDKGFPRQKSLPPALSPTGPETIFPILLVIARDLDSSRSREEINPSTIQCALLKTQQELIRRKQTHRIHLEVVRPGSLDELKQHLKKSNSKGEPFFRVVHFDLHGVVDDVARKAYVMFNSYKEGQLVTKPVEANDIAESLRSTGVQCVLLNVCQSATANAGLDANLGRVLLQNGISNVLAMSFKISHSMADKFYSAFYKHFFLDGDDFSEAARAARSAIRQDSKRINAFLEPVKMEDWFFPVTYIQDEVARFALDEHKSRLCENVPHLSEMKTLDLFVGSFLVFLVTFFYDEVIRLAFDDDKDRRCRHMLQCIAVTAAGFMTPRTASFLIEYSVVVRLLLCSIGHEISMILFHKCHQQYEEHCFNRTYPKLKSDLLDTNILRVEGNLIKAKTVFFHSAQGVEQRVLPMLNSLIHIWQRTHFVQHPKLIRAESFSEVRLWRKLLHFYWDAWKGIKCHDYEDPFEEEEDNPKMQRNKTVIIIQNVHKLFPERKTNKYKAAEKIMMAWLKEHTESQRAAEERLYILLVGKGETTWLKTNLGNYPFLKGVPLEYTRAGDPLLESEGIILG